MPPSRHECFLLYNSRTPSPSNGRRVGGRLVPARAPRAASRRDGNDQGAENPLSNDRRTTRRNQGLRFRLGTRAYTFSARFQTSYLRLSTSPTRFSTNPAHGGTFTRRGTRAWKLHRSGEKSRGVDFGFFRGERILFSIINIFTGPPSMTVENLLGRVHVDGS